MRMLIKLFLSFAYVGAFTFGGGYSMLPMFKRVIVEKNSWLTDLEMTDYFSVSQCLPGVVAINTSVFVGYRQKKLPGSIAAALGVAFPSIVIILILAALITNFASYPIVQKAFGGIRVCVGALILKTVIDLWKHAIVDKLALVIFVAIFLVSFFTSLSVALLIAAAGVSGIVISALRKGGAK